MSRRSSVDLSTATGPVKWPGRTVEPLATYEPLPVGTDAGFTIEMFERVAAEAPARDAVVTDTETLSLGDLNGQANAVAARILEEGSVEPGVVPMFMDHGAEKCAAAIGVIKSGSAFVRIDPIHKDQGVRDLFAHSQASIVLTDRPNMARARRLAPEGVVVIEVSGLLALPVEQNPSVPITANTIMYIGYTTGSTGNPKGAIRTHGNDRETVLSSMAMSKMAVGDRMAFMQGFWQTQLMGGLISGATIYPYDLRRHGFNEMKRWLLRHEITCYRGIVTGFRQFLESLGPDDYFPAMRIVDLTGEPLYREDFERFDRAFSRRCAFVATYSASEQTSMAYFVPDRSAMPVDGDIVPIGYPMPHVDVQLLDEDHRPICPGTIGEIAFRSEVRSLGYWRDAALSAEIWQADRTKPGRTIYWTGDLAVMDENGCLHGCGRADLQVKIRGHRVLLGEIEAILIQHPAIKNAVVVMDRNDQGHNRLVGYFTSETGAVPSTSGLRAYLGRQLPNHMVPAVFMPMDSFVLTVSGKIDRRALPPAVIDIHNRSRDVVAPANVVEATLKDIWEELLQEEDISVEDDFFLIGGDSVMALTMFLEAEARLGRQLPFESLWLRGSTIRALALSIDGAAPAISWSQALPLQTNGHKPALFVVSMVSAPVYCLSLIQHLGSDQPVYGLPAKGIGGDELPDRRIGDMAAHCIAMMRQVQPDGPYRIMGFSAAGLVAFEMAQSLSAQGIDVSKLVLLDSALPTKAGAVAGKMVRQPLKAARFAGSLVAQSFGIAKTDAATTLRAARAGAYYRYRPKPYAGEVILITSTERNQSRVLVDRWRQLAEGGLITTDAPGDHLAMVQEPHVGALGQTLVRLLDV